MPLAGRQSQHVYRLLLAAIQTGEFPSGTRLPSQETLARRFGVATLTLRRALTTLEKQGFVVSHHGRGTFVLAQSPDPGAVESDEASTAYPRFADQFRDFPVAIVTWRVIDDDWVLVDANRAAYELTDSAIRSLFGQRASKLYADHPEVLEDFKRCKSQRRPVRRDMSWLLTSNGEQRDLVVTYAFVAPDLVMVYAEDETERMEAERALRVSEERLRSLVSASQDAIFWIEGDGTISFANQRAADLHGYGDPSDLVGLPGSVLVAPDYRAQAQDNRMQVMDGVKLQGIEYPAQRSDGTTFLAEVTASVIDAVDQPQAMTVMIRDVSERKQAEERLLEERPRLNALLEERVAARTAEILNLQKVTAALSEAMNPTEVAGVIVSHVLPLVGASGGSIRVLADDGKHLDYIGGSGNAPEVLLSSQRIPLTASSPFTDAVRERSALWMESLDAWQTRYPEEPDVQTADGHEAAAVIALVAKGGPVGVLGIKFAGTRQFDDDEKRFMLSVTQQCAQALERARLYDAERRRAVELQSVNRELESFSYSVSHDLRSPLRGIAGFSKLVGERYSDKLDDTGKEYLGRIGAATERMSLLIDDLLNLSRITRSEIHQEQVDMSEMARDVLRDLVASEPDRQVTSVIQPDLSTHADPRLLRVVLENLLGNAWKFTSKRDGATIEAGSQDLNGEKVYFVRDNGVGFDMAYADNLFGPFQRLHSLHEFQGTGIGLANVQRIVNRHGGRTWAEAAVDQGTTVYFTLRGQ